jgi:hypothetical protein
MLDDLGPRVARCLRHQTGAEVLGEMGVVHGGVRAESDKDGEPRDPAVKGAVDGAEEERERAGSRTVGNEHADAPTIEGQRAELVRDERLDFAVGEGCTGSADNGGHLDKSGAISLVGHGSSPASLRWLRRSAPATTIGG